MLSAIFISRVHPLSVLGKGTAIEQATLSAFLPSVPNAQHLQGKVTQPLSKSCARFRLSCTTTDLSSIISLDISWLSASLMCPLL